MKLKHPNGGPTVETTGDKSATYISQGWVEVKPPAEKKPDAPKGK